MSKILFPDKTYSDETVCGTLYTTIVWTDDTKKHIKKIIPALGKSGTCAMAQMSVICELLTGIYKHCSIPDRKSIFAAASGHKCGGHNQTTCSDIIIRRLLAIDMSTEK